MRNRETPFSTVSALFQPVALVAALVSVLSSTAASQQGDIFSPIDPNTVYASSNLLWRTTDGGANWDALSPDLTRADPMTLGHSGGPITGDMNGPIHLTVRRWHAATTNWL